MARVNGTTGNVTFGTGYTTNVKAWRLNFRGAALDSSAFDTGAAKAFIPGQTEWAGSYDCFLDGTAVTVAPGAAAAAATFTASTGRTYAGSIIVTSVSPVVVIDGINQVTIDFQGTGALTIA